MEIAQDQGTFRRRTIDISETGSADLTQRLPWLSWQGALALGHSSFHDEQEPERFSCRSKFFAAPCQFVVRGTVHLAMVRFPRSCCCTVRVADGRAGIIEPLQS